MNRRISVRAIVLDEGKLLCVRQKPKDPLTRSMANRWNLPGGGLNENESLLDCLHREMVEETGVAPIAGNLMYVQQFTHSGTEFLEFFFNVTNSKDYLHVNLALTTHGEEELDEIDFIDPSTSDILPTFLTSEPLFESTKSPTKIFTSL